MLFLLEGKKNLQLIACQCSQWYNTPDMMICRHQFQTIFGHQTSYRIYSINRPGRLLNFCTLRVGAYSRWALIQGWALVKLSPFSASEVCLFCKKKKMLIPKREEVTKQGFSILLWKKLRPRGSLLLELIHSSGWDGGECLYEFDWEEEGWARIRGWALINFFFVQDGRLFEVGANLQLGAYSNKYGIQRNVLIQ